MSFCTSYYPMKDSLASFHKYIHKYILPNKPNISHDHYNGTDPKQTKASLLYFALNSLVEVAKAWERGSLILLRNVKINWMREKRGSSMFLVHPVLLIKCKLHYARWELLNRPATASLRNANTADWPQHFEKIRAHTGAHTHTHTHRRSISACTTATGENFARREKYLVTFSMFCSSSCKAALRK